MRIVRDESKIEKRVRELLQNDNLLRFNILRIAKKGKHGLSFIIDEILRKYNAKELKDDVFAILCELIFNAIKANYKFILVKDRLSEYLKENETDKSIDEIFSEPELLEKYLDKIDLESIQQQVREILSGEEAVTKIQEKAHKEGRKLSIDERKEIRRKLSTMFEARKRNINVYLSFNFDDDSLIIDVINTAPIFQRDLERIKDKRSKFRKYYDEDRQQDFYVENLDETESAGFGAAMIDARFLENGIDPSENFEIWGFQNKTAITINFPLNRFKSKKLA